MLGLILFFFYIWLVSLKILFKCLCYTVLAFTEVKLLNYMHFEIMQVCS